ncbi:GumC family protein [Chthonobacter rhizosphaerae]|uniref:GumC family protein n=1 Tax=Chthonobacter rhizosphaerae TaxID=2735553 RepID=UPI0015EF7038|nr:Wzz/FepE/Etk N-terminal domain-containing protein [Chthonobacter rhizosphaerae]
MRQVPTDRASNLSRPDVDLQAEPAGNEVDIRLLLGTVRRQSRLILATLALVMALAALFVFTQVPVYTSTALVFVDPRVKNILDPELQTNMSADVGRVESEVEILRSDSTLLAVLSDLTLMTDPEFAPKLGLRDQVLVVLGLSDRASLQDGERAVQKVLDSLRESFVVSRLGRTYLISVQASSISPAKAAQLANTAARVYIQQQIDAKVANALGARDALNRRLSRASGEIDAIEEKIDGFVTTNLEAIASESNRADLVALRMQLEAAKSQGIRAGSLSSVLGRYQEQKDWEAIARELSSEAVKSLEQQRSALVRSLQAAGTDTPQAFDLQGQLARIETDLGKQVSEEIEKLRLQSQVAQEQENKLRDQLRETVLANNLPTEMVSDLYRLQKEADVTRGLYQDLLQRMRDAEAQADLQLPDSRIVSVATAPTRPSAPKIQLILSGAFLAALGLGVGLAFVYENFVGGFTSEDQLEAVSGVPAISTVPLLNVGAKGDETRPEIAFELVRRPLSAYSESIRRTRLAVELMTRAGDADPSGRGKAILVMVVSAVPAEGKTTTAVALARAFAITGRRTALIDCDLRRPAVAAAVGVEPSTSLIDFLSQAVDTLNFRDFVTVDEATGMQMILGSRPNRVPTDSLIESGRFKRLINLVRDRFDVVVLDTPPVLPVVDSQYLASYADLAVLVVRYASTSQREVRAAVSDLRAAGGDQLVIGAVLNQTEGGATGYRGKYQGYYHSAPT